MHTDDMAKNVVKCCLVGDAMVGKTAVVQTFLDKDLKQYTPTVFDNYAVHRESFQNVNKFWVPELKKYARRRPLLILVDTHCELNNTSSSDTDKPVSIEEGFSMAQEIEAVSFIECGTLSKETSRKIFTDAVINTVKKKKNKTSKFMNLFKR
ncbi:hypothetical protein CHS0354_007674 [Potamilus streckersoni]|uniref:Uncharacterized protein n=1 Tax=Potamilus streckersoni TaxID=2493646 RepID=A0AAE0SH33_9BIVA|nr:hypothetical protein CHS0354_007674 [Potamilus streckersoni]